MRKLHFLLFLFLIVALAFAVTACKKHPPKIEPEAPPPAAQPQPSEQQPPEVHPMQEGEISEQIIAECTKQMQPVFFDFNKSDIRQDMITALQNNARVLKAGNCANVKLLIEGHCDERGTEEYNLALGERRATAAKDYMINLGIPEDRISIISYGESRPFAEGHNEEAWRQNRRAHFVAVKK